MPFGVVSGVSSGIVVLDGCPLPQGEGPKGEVLGFFLIIRFLGPLVLMAFLSSFEREIVFDLCVKSL